MRPKHVKRPDRIRLWLSVIAVFGILLRFLYVLATPYSVREHDVWSHIEYIEYVAIHATLPDPHASSQFYHPPLYYFLMAPAFSLATRSGLSRDEALTRLQIFSFLFSIATFMITLWIGTLLFRKRTQRTHLILFSALLATAPGLIFFAPRINNDALAQVFLFGGLALLLYWWQRPRLWIWLLLIVVLSLGILVKGTVLILLPIAFLSMIWKSTIRLRQRALQIALALVLLLALTGWFYIPRALSERDARSTLVGNVHILTDFVDDSPAAFLTFNPISIVRDPFNNLSSENERRGIFWEYVLRSAFFGEFNFGTPYVVLAQMILTASLIGIVIAARHLWLDIRLHGRQHLPLVLTLGLLLLTQMGYRIVYPYCSAQDFRYGILLLVPLGYYAVTGLENDPPVLRTIGLVSIGTIILCCTAFLLSVSLQAF